MKVLLFGSLFAISAFATDLYTYSMEQFDVTSPDEATIELLKKNKDCSRSIVLKYMQKVVWNQNMEDGVDLSESLDLEMIDIVKTGSEIKFEIFLSATETVKGTAVRYRSGCLVDLQK